MQWGPGGSGQAPVYGCRPRALGGDSHLRWEWHARVEVQVGGCRRSAGTRREVREASGAQVASDLKLTRRGHRAEDRIPETSPCTRWVREEEPGCARDVIRGDRGGTVVLGVGDRELRRVRGSGSHLHSLLSCPIVNGA